MSAPLRVDLFSDTQTRPSPEMRAAMAAADVGDEQMGEDPTVNELQDVVAQLFDLEAALFLPSGTMCNQISFSVHCRAGDEILMHRSAHPLNFEAGGAAALVGALITPLDGDRGIFSPADLRAALRYQDRHSPRTRAVSVEQTTNMGGGACWPIDRIEQIRAVADEAGLAKHMDGARLMNAVVATGVPAKDYAAGFDSCWLDLSKGLGCPVGGVLAGSRAFIDEAWHYKQLLGGAMRQAGIIAAAGIYALRNNVDRLADDHLNARRLAEGLAEPPGGGDQHRVLRGRRRRGVQRAHDRGARGSFQSAGGATAAGRNSPRRRRRGHRARPLVRRRDPGQLTILSVRSDRKGHLSRKERDVS
jgi:threonine aldolase